jgi:hypothetical protein
MDMCTGVNTACGLEVAESEFVLKLVRIYGE